MGAEQQALSGTELMAARGLRIRPAPATAVVQRFLRPLSWVPTNPHCSEINC